MCLTTENRESQFCQVEKWWWNGDVMGENWVSSIKHSMLRSVCSLKITIFNGARSPFWTKKFCQYIQKAVKENVNWFTVVYLHICSHIYVYIICTVCYVKWCIILFKGLLLWSLRLQCILDATWTPQVKPRIITFSEGTWIHRGYVCKDICIEYKYKLCIRMYMYMYMYMIYVYVYVYICRNLRFNGVGV